MIDRPAGNGLWRRALRAAADRVGETHAGSHETQKTLFCSDLFHQTEDVEALTTADVVGRSYQAMREYQTGILSEYVPYTPLTSENLRKLAALKPRTLAIMHGSSFSGDGARALQDLDAAFREVFGRGGTT